MKKDTGLSGIIAVIILVLFYLSGCVNYETRISDLERGEKDISALSKKVDDLTVKMDEMKCQISGIQCSYIEDTFLELLNSSPLVSNIFVVLENILKFTPEQSAELRRLTTHEVFVSLPPFIRACNENDRNKMSFIALRILDKIREIMTKEQRLVFDPMLDAVIIPQVNTLIQNMDVKNFMMMLRAPIDSLIESLSKGMMPKAPEQGGNPLIPQVPEKPQAPRIKPQAPREGPPETSEVYRSGLLYPL